MREPSIGFSTPRHEILLIGPVGTGKSTLGRLGRIDRLAKRWGAARGWYERALEAWRPFGLGHTAGVLRFLSKVAREQGDFARAEQAYQEALHIYRAQADLPGHAAAQCLGGDLALAQGYRRVARGRYAEAVTVARQMRNQGAKRDVLKALARFAAAEGDTETASALTADGAAIGDGLTLAASFLKRA